MSATAMRDGYGEAVAAEAGVQVAEGSRMIAVTAVPVGAPPCTCPHDCDRDHDNE